MKRKRTLVPALLITLLLGLATSVAVVSPRAAVSAIRDALPTTTDVTTTDDTTTAPADTTSAPSDTTSVTTTSVTTDTTPTTTVDSQSGSNTSTTGQGSEQGNVDAPATTTAPTTTATAPPISCSNGQLDCGNNAATQIAVVSQTCQNTAQDTVNISVQAVDGTPHGTYTINPQTCINVAQITQVVQQFCINCTIILVPTPAAAAAAAPAARSAPPRAFYCAPSPVLRTDGTWGTFLDLEKGQPSFDPRYANATPAPFDLAHGGYYCAGSGGPATLQGAPVFTLTVPASFVGQVLRLCIQPADPAQKPVCHDVRIDQGATISVPVTSNVAATVHLANGKQKNVNKNASPAALAAASKRLSHTSAKPRACTKSKVKPHKCTRK